QGNGPLPLAAGSEDLPRAVVEVEMPERAHVLGFVAADLPVLAALGRQLFAESALRPRTRLAKQAVGLHVPPHGAIRPQRSHGGLGLDRRSEVVVVQLVGPVLVIVVLP